MIEKAGLLSCRASRPAPEHRSSPPDNQRLRQALVCLCQYFLQSRHVGSVLQATAQTKDNSQSASCDAQHVEDVLTHSMQQEIWAGTLQAATFHSPPVGSGHLPAPPW